MAALASTDPVPAPCAYQAQNCPMTLSEGLAEYYAANRGRVTPPQALPPESAALFRGHDICHVVFGLGTTPADEAVVDTRAILSCDVGWRRYCAYLASDAVAKAIFKQVGYGMVVWASLQAAPRLFRALMEARHMTRRWPWDAPAAYFQRPLADLRREFGIRIV